MEKKICNIYCNCLFDEEDVLFNKPLKKYVSVSYSITRRPFRVYFDVEKLNNKKSEVVKLFNRLSLDNVSKVEDLFYDIDNNKWCDNLDVIDQLLQLGLACGIIKCKVTKHTATITRINENDKTEMVGKMARFTEPERKALDENRSKITEELIKHLETINVGLGFYGIQAVINDKELNVLDFYDKENNLICSFKYKDTNGLKLFQLGNRLTTEFTDKNKCNYSFTLDERFDNRFIFHFNCKERGCKIELTYDKENHTLKVADIYSVDKHDDYIIKKIDIRHDELRAELNNQFGPYGNYVDGEKRMIWYITPENERIYPAFFMAEEVWPNTGAMFRQISEETGRSIALDDEYTTGPLSYSKFNKVALNITRHPRNKETIQYTIDELDKKYPGIKELVVDNFPIYSLIMDGEYVSEPGLDEMIRKTIIAKCDIKNNTTIKSINKNSNNC